ncbi:MAG: four helix bundle protein [Brevefilum sp.]|nr:four helix bundle protein [Brevefilum sp.]
MIDELETSRKHYRLFEQIESAVTSIPMNIAEGMQSTPSGKVEIQKKSSFNSSIMLAVRFMKH